MFWPKLGNVLPKRGTEPLPLPFCAHGVVQPLLENACDFPRGGEFLCGGIDASGNDQGRPSFVDENGVGFVDQAEVEVLRLHRS